MNRAIRAVISLCLMLVLALAAAGPVEAAKRRVPFGFFATGLDAAYADPATVSDQALDSQMGLMARSGVESLRVSFNWSQIEPAQGSFDFAIPDRLVMDAARHRLSLLANVGTTPSWASERPSSSLFYRYAPKSPQLLGSFLTKLVRRYGPHGEFWKLNPGLRPNPVRDWQIWNEQGFFVFWASKPWPQTYTRALRAAYRAIHSADHGAKVVAGSIVDTGLETQWQEAEDLYRAGAKKYFDIISVHPFTDGSIPVSQSVSRAIMIVQFVRDVMRRHGDGRKPIILTELTWPAARGFVSPKRLIGVETTPHGEILRLSAVYNYLATHIRQTGVTQAYWFTWASSFDRNDPRPDVSYRFAGLLRFANGSFIAQPVLRTYARLAAHYEGCAKGADARRCR